MRGFLRVFGSGPLGLLLSLVSVAAVSVVRSRYFPTPLGLPATLRLVVLACGSLATLAGVLWSFRSLPVAQRGRALCVRGAYRWVRHPLYASFITIAAPALALSLDHWIFLLWVGVLHVIWHLVIPSEERLMVARFGEEYHSYARRTGRFVPRLADRDLA